MAHALATIILIADYIVLGYFLLINGVYAVLYIISYFELSSYTRKEKFSGFSDLLSSDFAPAVSVIVPAYNEEATIAASVRSFLALQYPRHEVIVVNDGSKDGTLDVLIQEFKLWGSDQPIQQELKTAPLKAVYRSASERLTLIDKENGGKADALNLGICAAKYPFVCCIDADIILEEDALLRIARPLIESSEVVAVGGIVRVANGCEIDHGRVVNVRTPKSSLALFQAVEYLRAFLAGRTAWSVLNCMLIISGAFGMFRRRDLIEANGYAHDTVGEDMEVVTRMHRALRERKQRYKVVFVPDPVAWTEVPETLRVLHRQRDRWHRGLLDTLSRHRRMMLNPRYGTVGMIGMPYYFLFESFGPVVELLGYIVFIVSIGLALEAGKQVNLVFFEFAIAFFVAAVVLGILLSVAAVLLEELRLRRYPRWRDLGKLTLFGILENFGYRQLNTLWRVVAIFSYFRKSTEWGAMERKGFSPKQK